MRILLTTGEIIEAGLKIDSNEYEIKIRLKDGKEIALRMNPDEFKWFALDVHKLANQSI